MEPLDPSAMDPYLLTSPTVTENTNEPLASGNKVGYNQFKFDIGQPGVFLSCANGFNHFPCYQDIFVECTDSYRFTAYHANATTSTILGKIKDDVKNTHLGCAPCPFGFNYKEGYESRTYETNLGSYISVRNVRKCKELCERVGCLSLIYSPRSMKCKLHSARVNSPTYSTYKDYQVCVKEESSQTSNNRCGICGVDTTVDQERLLSEWNAPYIFKFLNKKDKNPKYTTQVFEVVSFSSSGEVVTKTTTTTTETPPTETEVTTEESGLVSLFVAPPTYQCNSEALEEATNGREGFYPVFLGLLSNFSAPMNMFLADAESLQTGYNGEKPRLCGTKLFMGQLQWWIRYSTLKELFNFPYIENRQVLRKPFKECKSIETTNESIQKSSFFDTTSQMWIEGNDKTVYETDGFAGIVIHRESRSEKRMVGHLKTSLIANINNSASDEDFTDYDGPIVFGRNSTTTLAVIGIKRDNTFEGLEALAVSLSQIDPKTRNMEFRLTIEDAIVQTCMDRALLNLASYVGNTLQQLVNWAGRTQLGGFVWALAGCRLCSAQGLCVQRKHFLVEFENNEVGPFRKRTGDGKICKAPLPPPIPPQQCDAMPDVTTGSQNDPLSEVAEVPVPGPTEQERTRYKSTYDARINIPIRAVITLDKQAKPPNCVPPNLNMCNWSPGGGHTLDRPNVMGHDFVTDLRRGVTPVEWNLEWDPNVKQDYTHRLHDAGLLNAAPDNNRAFNDYTHPWKYKDNNPFPLPFMAPVNANDKYTRGHLVSSAIFRNFFKRDQSDVAFDFMTYMTNIFPQRDTQWVRKEEEEIVAGKHCLEQNDNNKFHIAKGTIPSARSFMRNDNIKVRGAEGYTNVNIPRYIYMAYCCTTHYGAIPFPRPHPTGHIQSSQFVIVEQAIWGINTVPVGQLHNNPKEIPWNNKDRLVKTTQDELPNDPHDFESVTALLAKLRTLWDQEQQGTNANDRYNAQYLFREENNPCPTLGQAMANRDGQFEIDDA